MKVEDLMTKQVLTCLAGDVVGDAAILMDREGRGCLFVLADDGSGRVVGVLTDRDICLSIGNATPEDLAAGGMRVRSLMSAEPHACRPGDSLSRALVAIESCGCRRLAVVDEGRHLLGVITLTDIARASADPARSGVSPEDVCRALIQCAGERRDPEHLLLG